MLKLKRQSDKRRLMTALRGGQPDCVPYLDLEIAAPIVDAVLGTPGNPLCVDLPPAEYIRFARAVGLDAVYVNFLWTLGRRYAETEGGSRQYVDGLIKSPVQLDAVQAPDISGTLRRLEELAPLAADAGLGIILGCITPYKTVKAAVGYQDFLLQLHDDPEFLVRFRDLVSGHLAAALKTFLRYPVDAVLIPGDLCSGNGPLLAPDTIRSFWLDNTREFLQPVRDKDIPVILHMDGDFSPILDLILEPGVQALHPFEVTGNLDIYAVKPRLQNRVAVMGNINCAGVLTRGTPDEVRQDVRAHIARLAPGGGYVCGSSHEISADVPFANFQALVEAVDEFGAY